jgi:hypothetical protein
MANQQFPMVIEEVTDPEEAWAWATTAHPEDDGSFIRYIPREKVARIYANQRRVAAL